MALINTKKLISKPINYTNPVAAKIQQRRLQILVHSYLYYVLENPIITDTKWNEWAKELQELQEQNIEVAKKVIYSNVFKDFNASTGFDLTYDDKTKERAERLLAIHERSD